MSSSTCLSQSRSRRRFLKAVACGAVFSIRSARAVQQPSLSLASAGCITDIEGIKLGHYTETRRPTGCTVVLTEAGAIAGVDVRGASPGTRETDLLNPINSVEKVHGIVLAGGSAFGLEAADGVMQYLEEQKVGYPTRVGRVPIVPAAILYDLDLGDARIRPDKRSGYLACKAAKTHPCEEGNVGAGTGATVGKLFGIDRAMKSGLGTAAIRVGPHTVAALVAVNAVGDVLDPATGVILAGARTADGKKLANSMELLRKGHYGNVKQSSENTTIGVVATNAVLSKVQASKIAQMAHDGLARSINPVHTPLDGDTLFAIATGTVSAAINLTLLGALAAEVVTQAVCRGVLRAKGLPGLPSCQEMLIPGKRG